MTQGRGEHRLHLAAPWAETAVAEEVADRTATIGNVGGSAIRVQLTPDQVAYLRSLVCDGTFPDLQSATSHMMHVGTAVYSAARDIRDPDKYD